MGGHAGGDVASSLATQTVTAIADERFETIEIARERLVDAVKTSAVELVDAVREHPDLTGMGTTVSALLRHNNQMVIAHIGDSRVYRFRGGVLEQITADHTFVQKLVETGRITAEEALVHPRRNVLMRVLGDYEGSVDIDSSIVDTEPGDRWLLCSDGLCGFVPEQAISQVLATEPDAAKAAERLIEMTLDRGAPDNVTIVIVGVNETNMSAAAKPQLVGAAAMPLLFDAVTRPLPRTVSRLFVAKSGTEAEELFRSADYLDTLVAEDKRRAAQRRSRWAIYISLAFAAVIGFGVYGYVWTQSQFFVGADEDSVVVYRGINGDFGTIPLHTVVRDTDIPLSSLDDFVRTSVELTIPVLSLKQALLVVERIENVSQSQ